MKKILLVDHDPMVRNLTMRMMAEHYEIIPAKNGREALDLFHEVCPDLVVLDNDLPKVSGREVFSEIRKQKGRNVPVIYVFEKDEPPGGREDPPDANVIVRKPYQPDDLIREADEILSAADREVFLKKHISPDEVTGLLKLSAAEAYINEYLQRGEGGTLMKARVDGYVEVGQKFGPKAADGLMLRFADVLKQEVRKNDIIAHLPGDGFIIFCRGIYKHLLIAEKSGRINTAVVLAAKRLLGKDHGINIGASIGAVVAPDEGTDFGTLHGKANAAMNVVERGGKHGVTFFTELGEARADRRTADLENAKKVFAERNAKPGAFGVEYGSFPYFFRYAQQFAQNYNRQAAVVIFSLCHAEEAEEDVLKSGEAGRAFWNMLLSSLRRSDVVTEIAKNRFVVILSEVSPEGAKAVVERISLKWMADAFGVDCSFDSRICSIFVPLNEVILKKPQKS